MLLFDLFFISPLGIKLIKIKNRSGLNRGEFAKKVGYSPAYLTQLITGVKKNPSERFYDSVCEKFKVDKLWLKEGRYPQADDDKKQILSIFDMEVPVYAKRIDDLVISLKNLLTGFEERFNNMESRIAALEEKKDITDPGPAEEVTGKRET